MQSRRVRFVTTTAGLVNELLEARDDRVLSKIVARYARVELLILDEVAYVPLSHPEAELLFQVLDERSELSSIMMTTNLPVRGVDQGVPRGASVQGDRRPSHLQRPHHRDRHRVVAFQEDPRAPAAKGGEAQDSVIRPGP
jgi:DNA replication protein DnaC